MAEPSDAVDLEEPKDRSLDPSERTEPEKKENDADFLDQTVEKVAIETVVSSKMVEEAKFEVLATSADEQVEETDVMVREESTVDSITDCDSVGGSVPVAADEGEGTPLQGSLVDIDQKKQEAGSTEHQRTEDAELMQSQVYSVEMSQDPRVESNTESKANYDGEETDPQADIITKDPVLDDPCREEMEVRDVHMENVGQDNAQEAYVLQTTSAESNRNVQEESVAFDDTVGQQAARISVHTQIFGGESEAVDEPTLNLQNDASQEASTALGFVFADEDLGVQVDHVAKELSPADPMVEIQHQEICEDEACNESTMDGSRGMDDTASVGNIKEENVVLDKAPVDDTLGQADHGIVDTKSTDSVPEVVADTILEVQPRATVREREGGCGSVMDDDHDSDEGAPIPKAHAVVTCKSNDEGDGSFDSVPVGDAICHKTDFVSEDAKLYDKVRDVETVVDDGLIVKVDEFDDGVRCAHEVFSLQEISSVEMCFPLGVRTDSKVPKDLQKGANELKPNHIDDEIGPRADVTSKDPLIADQEVEVQVQETGSVMVVDNVGIMNDDEDNSHDASVPLTSLMDTKRNIQGAGSLLEPDPFDGTIGHKSGCITSGPNQDKPVVVQNKVICQETKAGNESMVNRHKDTSQPASVTQTVLVYSRRNILKEANRLGKVFAADSLHDQSDHLTKARMKHTEADGGDGSIMEGGDSRDHEASILHTSLTAINQNQNALEESVTVYDSAPLEVDHYKNIPNLVNPSMEVESGMVGVQTEVSDGPEINADQDTDREASSLKTALVETNQNVFRKELEGWTAVPVAKSDDRGVNSTNDGTLGSKYLVTGVGLAENVLGFVGRSAETHPFGKNVVVLGEITKADANPVIELQSQSIQLVDQSADGKQDITGTVSCSVVETKNGGVDSIDEKLIVTGDTVMEISNSIVETDALKASELSEIHTVLSQGKEYDDLLHDPNPDTETKSADTLVDENLGESAHILELSLENETIFTVSEGIKKDMPSSNACKKVESIQELEGKQEIQAPRNTENVQMDDDTDAKQNVQVEEGVVLQGTDKQVVDCSAMSTSVSPMENKQHISYRLPSMDTTIFSMADLVWGKVKSHPWWPGQIFDPSNASQLALKYQKKASFLVAYFGDKTFAWCDESQLKPFFSYFSQMEKQCSSDTFGKAINDIMVEISRRVELGMSCSCVPEETYADIKFQKVDNAGVRKGNVTPILDRPLVLNYFQPHELMEYIKKLAQFPNGGVDRLELVIAKSQLKAFYSSKGYPELSKFTVDGGLIVDVAEIPMPNVKGSGEDTAKPSAPVIPDLSSGEVKLRSRDNSVKKRKHVMVNDRKQKSTSDLTDKENTLHLGNGGGSKSGLESSERLISSSSGTKHAVFVSDSTGSGRPKKETLDFFEDIEPTSPSPAVTSSFKIGEFIRRAASQLTGAPPLVKCQQETFPVNFPQDDHSRGNVTDFDALLHAPEENEGMITSLLENSSPNEMFSQLCLAARDPMNGDIFVPMIAFFTSFRNSITPEDKKNVEKCKRGRPRKVIIQPLFSDINSSEEKPAEKRKRVRPVRYSLGAISDSSSSKEKQHAEICSSRDRHVEKRTRGRPKKVVSQPAISDISSSEEKHVEKPKRGRPRKMTSQLASSDTSAPDYMKDSYSSDTKLQRRRRKKFSSDDCKEKDESHRLIRQKRKAAGEVSLSLPSEAVPENEHQLQLVTMSPNKKYSFIAERAIISVKEKITEEHMPTALILSFSSSSTLPSPSDLIRIFSRYGPLEEAETEILRKTNRARVVFKRRTDAESAFSSAGKYSIFGAGLLSYQLKSWSCSSKPVQQITQVQRDAASATKPQETNDTTSIVVPQDNLNPAIATLQGDHDPANNHETCMTTANDRTIPVSRPQDDSGSISMPKKKQDVGPMQGRNLDIPAFPEAAEDGNALDAIPVEADAKISPRSNYDATSIPQPEEYHDEASGDTTLNKHDSTPITTSGDCHDAVPLQSSSNTPPLDPRHE